MTKDSRFDQLLEQRRTELVAMAALLPEQAASAELRRYDQAIDEIANFKYILPSAIVAGCLVFVTRLLELPPPVSWVFAGTWLVFVAKMYWRLKRFTHETHRIYKDAKQRLQSYPEARVR